LKLSELIVPIVVLTSFVLLTPLTHPFTTAATAANVGNTFVTLKTYPTSTVPFESVYCADSNSFVAAASHVALISTDGGLSWVEGSFSSSSTLPNALFSVSCTKSTRCITSEHRLNKMRLHIYRLTAAILGLNTPRL
jgi:hypothetical protein